MMATAIIAKSTGMPSVSSVFGAFKAVLAKAPALPLDPKLFGEARTQRRRLNPSLLSVSAGRVLRES